MFAFIKDPSKLEDPQAPMSSDEFRAFMMFRLGAALADLMEPVDADRYLSVAADPSAGDARRMILRNLGKLRDGRALNVLVRALKDSDVAAPAIGGLGRLRTVPASELIGHIEPLLDSPDENVRGKVYIGISKNMHARIHRHLVSSKSAIHQAGYGAADIDRVKTIAIVTG